MLKKGLVLLAAYFIIAAVLGVAVQGFAGQVWSSWVDYRPPRFHHQLSPNPGTPPLVKRVIVVLVDGARPDLVEKYATTDGFTRIIKEGCWFGNAWAYQPSYSVPARAAIATGLPHEITGVSSNWYDGGELGFPNIFSLAKEKGLRTAVVGDSSVYGLFKSSIDTYIEVEETAEHSRIAVEEAIRLLKSNDPPDLLWIGMAGVDKAGHEYGAASGEYRRAIEEASRLLGMLLDTLAGEGMANDTLVVVVSDHGHLDTGGHGGPEKEVTRVVLGLIGPHVARGIRIDRRVMYTSVAPTIAMALGLPAKITAYGPPLVWAFTDDTLNITAPYSLATARNLYYHLDALAKAVGVEVGGLDKIRDTLTDAESLLRSGDLEGSINETVKAFDSMLQFYESVRAAASHGGFKWSAVVAGILALMVGVVAASSRVAGRRASIAAILSGIAGIAVFWVFFVGVERFLPTMSSVNELGDYVGAVMKSSIAALLASGLLVAVVVRLKKLSPAARLPYVLIVTHVSLVAMASLHIYVTLVFYGAYVRFPFPDWSLAYLYYTSLISDVFLLLLGWLLPLAAGLVWLLLGRLEKTGIIEA